MSRTTFPFLEILTLLVVLFACLIVFVPGTDTSLIAWLDSLRAKPKNIGASPWPDGLNRSEPEQTKPNPPKRLASRLSTPLQANVSEVLSDFEPRPDTQIKVDSEFESDFDSELELESNDFDLQLEDQSELSIHDDPLTIDLDASDQPEDVIVQNSSSDNFKSREIAMDSFQTQDWDSESKAHGIPSKDKTEFSTRTRRARNTPALKTKNTLPNDKYINNPDTISNPFAMLTHSGLAGQTRFTKGNITVVRNKFAGVQSRVPTKNLQPRTEVGNNENEQSDWEIEALPTIISKPQPIQRSPMTSLKLLSPDNGFRPQR